MDPGGLEENYVRECHSALMTHVADREYSLLLQAVAAGIGLAGAVLGVSIVLAISSHAVEPIFSGATIPKPHRYWMTGGMFGLLAIVWVAWKASLAVAGPFWPALAEYNGRNSIQFSLDEDDTPEKFAARVRHRIEAALRRGTIAVGRRFDPAGFLRQESMRVRWVWLALAIVVMLISIWLLHRAARP